MGIGLRGCLFDHSLVICSERDLLGHDIDCDLDAYMRLIVAAVPGSKINFRSETSSVVEENSANIC